MSDTVIPVQMFLSSGSKPGVFETSYNIDRDKFMCTCPGFKARNTCKHTKYLRKQLDETGEVAVPLSKRVSAEQMGEASESTEAFRNLVVKHAAIGVL